MTPTHSALTDAGPARRGQRPPVHSGMPKLRLVPFSVGVATGCILSALLALYVMHSPLPFADKGLRKPSSVPTAETSASAAAEPEQAPMRDKPQPQAVSPTGESLPSASPSKSDRPVEPLGTRYMLQVAAFRAASEADQMKARLAILGFEASISRVQREGAEVYRVRVGPFDQFETLNQMKASLADSGVESTVVRVLTE